MTGFKFIFLFLVHVFLPLVARAASITNITRMDAAAHAKKCTEATKTTLWKFDRDDTHTNTFVNNKLKEYALECCKTYWAAEGRNCGTAQMSYYAAISKDITNLNVINDELEKSYNPVEMSPGDKSIACGKTPSPDKFRPYFAVPIITDNRPSKHSEYQLLNDFDGPMWYQAYMSFLEGEPLNFWLYTTNSPCPTESLVNSCIQNSFDFLRSFPDINHSLHVGFFKWFTWENVKMEQSRNFFCGREDTDGTVGAANQMGLDYFKWVAVSKEMNFSERLTFTKIGPLEGSGTSGDGVFMNNLAAKGQEDVATGCRRC